MSNSIFHDASIIGIEYQEPTKSLTLKMRLSNKITKEVNFSSVYDFYLEAFCNQNILFDIVQYGRGKATIDETLLLFPGLTLQVIEFAKSNDYNVYILEPSSGMTGYIVSPTFTVSN